MEPVISLCLPTNGISEWVFPVIESIYVQNIDESKFEVIVTNNGNNEEFNLRMIEECAKHVNMVYKKTEAMLFHNQLEALKLANGRYFKFINHRETLIDGSLAKMIEFIEMNTSDKPVIYFANGRMKKDIITSNSFDGFVYELGKYASWTTGVGIWKSDYLNISNNIKIDNISPHSSILFANRDREKYVINNLCFSQAIESSHQKKGVYDIFKAFSVEEIAVTLNLYIDGDISSRTFNKVKREYKRYTSYLYWRFVIKKEPCSYVLDGFDSAASVFFNKYELKLLAYLIGLKNYLRKLLRF